MAKKPDVSAAYLASLGAGSRRTVAQSLGVLARMIGGEEAEASSIRWHALKRKDTVALRVRLRGEFAPTTANKILSVLRGVLRAARDSGLMREQDFQAAASLDGFKTAPGAEPVVVVTNDVVGRLRGACGADAGGLRDRAMLELFLCTGMRRAEAAHLDIGDYTTKTRVLIVRGERPEYHRDVVLGPIAGEALDAWLRVRTSAPGPLLLPVDRGGIIRFRRLTEQAIYDIFTRLGRAAGCPGITLRDLRRAFVVSLARTGRSLDEVRAMAGHASWITPKIYESHRAGECGEGFTLDNIGGVAASQVETDGDGAKRKRARSLS
jgi:site-specific recombinase XerD